MKPLLFILEMPFTHHNAPNSVQDIWFCSHCAIIETALNLNPDWLKHIIVKRLAFPKPRKELIPYLGEDNQWLPALILGDQRVINDPIEITNYLAQHYGGAAPHP